MVDAPVELVRACSAADVPDGGARLVTVRRRKIALFRVGEAVFALQSTCPHRGAPLCDGTVSSTRHEVICPWHRFRFDLRTGSSVTNPNLVTTSFPVEMRDGSIFVGIARTRRRELQEETLA